MNCHQILSGACNAGDRCFAIGSVEGIPFTAYAAGCNVVILASTFERVQIIPGANHGYVKISALDCSTDTGKIAAAYENKICIFEPTPVIESSKHNTHFLDYRWVQTGSFTSHSNVVTLSWNLEGTRLLTGGTNIQLWKSKSPTHQHEEEHTGVKFEIGESKETKQSNNAQADDVSTWENIWSCQTAIPIYHMAFSPDGTLFATCGRNDRLVKIWYENKQVLFPAKASNSNAGGLHHDAAGVGGGGGGAGGGGDLNFTYVYIAHPRAVSNIVWRKTSKYMPKGSVANMLVTSCLDNICRIWIETVLPDDGMVNMTQFDPLASQNPKFRTHRHKHRFMQRLKHMKTCFHLRRHMKAGAHTNAVTGGGIGSAGGSVGHGGTGAGGTGGGTAGGGGGGGAMGLGSSPASFTNYQGPIPSLPSSCSVHDFHSYGFQGSGVTPGMHFHLAASINAETDIPLVPSMQTSDPANQNVFILHWLNNKEMHFTLQAEAILQELTKKVIDEENGMHQQHPHTGGANSNHATGGGVGGGGAGSDMPDDALPHKKFMRNSKSVSVDDSGEEYSKYSQHTAATGATGLHLNSMSNTTSQNSLNNDQQNPITQLVDSLDNKIECLLRDWHQSPDLLFAIHPVDGSYLIWVIEWLDDYYPGSYRQAQVSFSTRIPSAFPLGDAMSMSTTVSLFNTGTHPLAFRDIANNVRSKDEFHKGGSDQNSLRSDQNSGQHFDKHDEQDEEQQQQQQQQSGVDDDDDNEQQDDGGERSAAGSGSADTAGAGTAGGVGGSATPGAALPLNVSPSVSMVTKHSNGTLNLWQLTFAFKTKFTQVLSIGHVSRASGHRFRVNDITCHPVLPLLVSTSHHNLPDSEAKSPMSPFEQPLGGSTTPGGSGTGGGGGGGSAGGSSNGDKDVFTPTGFCSELILWRVDSVGPLCHSGGVSELARINSPEISAFSNVAWIPTLLPSTTLGSYSNSPSACFVASDGENLRVYQAVIDARTLLAEISCSENLNTLHKSHSLSSMISNASSTLKAQRSALHDKLKVVSQQSTARPGCILQLDAISDAKHDWQNTQFLHVFQAQLITGGQRVLTTDMHDLEEPKMNALLESDMDAIVDLQRNVDFEEPFYIVNIEKTLRGSTIHMWRIVISSKQQNSFLSETAMYVPDSNLTQETEEQEQQQQQQPRRMSQGAETLTGAEHFGPQVEAPHISITTKKVCTQELPLPEGVDVIHASPAAGHLSSSSIYPACFAPYIIVTACSDSISRFWKCEPAGSDEYHWSEWKMFSRIQESAIEIPGQPLNISAAYSGRIACAYKYGKSFTRPNRGDPDSRYVNLCVAIYECESSGGSEWVLEDTIHLKNVHLPRINIGHGIDLSYLHDSRLLAKKQRLNQVLHTFAHDSESRSPRSGETTPELATVAAKQQSAAVSGLLTVPSFSTLQSLRKSIAENGNTCPLTQKHLVQLDWVSKEDGSHILTVAVGSKILLYTPVSSDIAQANIKAMKESRSVNRPILRKASSLAQPNFVDEIRWMKLRQIDLQTADGLPPLPMQISWVRDGILVVAMDSEMHVYSQWKPHYGAHFMALNGGGVGGSNMGDDVPDTRNLRDEDLRSLANESTQLRLKNVASMPLISKVSTANLQLLSHDKKRRLAANSSMANMNAGNQDGGFGGVGGGGMEPPANDDYMTDFGLFQASRIACPVLPQYHPKQLMELLNCGKIRWVKAILAHLVRCMSGSGGSAASGLPHDDDGSMGGGGGGAGGGGANASGARQRSWSRSRTLSISYTADTSNIQAEHRGSTTQIPEELMLDYAEINSIPPLPLWVLLNADREQLGGGKAPGCGDVNKDYDELFDMHNSDDNLDDLLSDGDQKRQERRLSLPDKHSISHFGPRQGQLLSRLLTHTHLPGLSSLDQMHLLALADTVATCNTDFSDKFAADMGKTQGGGGGGGAGGGSSGGLGAGGAGKEQGTDSLDDCGLRFLLAMKHFTYLLRCLPLQQRAQFQRQGVGTANIVWAYHSESEEELLHLIPSYTKGDLRWATLRDLGVGYWLKNINTLRRCVEKLAKCAYQNKEDPLDAAIYYLAMKKKSLVCGLFRTKRDEKMTTFFGNDFTVDRWRKAALKNAFVLLGKQRFEHAVAFFLLANSLNDAIEVCMNKLEDFQLALIIARLYEGDTEGGYYNRLLNEHVLGTEVETGRCDLTRAHPDPFLRSMTYWNLKKYQDSLNTLLLNGVGSLHSSYKEEDLLRPEMPHATNPNVFNFYIYLRTHPLLIRQNIAISAQEKRIAHVVLSGFSYAGDASRSGGGGNASAASDKQLQLEDSITAIERQLYFTTAHGHFKSGCPALALEVLNKLPMKISDSDAIGMSSMTGSQAPEQEQSKDDLINSGIMDQWQTSTSTEQFDWGAPVASSSTNEAKFEIKWDDDDDEDADADEDDADADADAVADDPTPQPPPQVTGKSFGGDSKMDIMAQQLKFVACLKILMEELSTLATGFEVDGGQLRYQLYMWLEREVEALKQLCNYCSSEQTNDADAGGDKDKDDMNASIYPSTERPTLHEILMQDKQDFEAKVMRAAKRKRWLKANETLLRTLLSYCSLHGASGGGLASVRMELVLLLQELQQEKTQQQLLSPLPFPTTLPLLSACVAGNKTVIADPIKYLQSQTVDMLQSIIKLLPFPGIEPCALSEIFVLRDLAVALSSCIYQSLCDSESFVVNNTTTFNGYPSPGMENIAKINSSFECSYLVGSRNAFNRRRKYSTDEPAGICTTPSKWPGVTNLRALLAREKDEDVPKLNVLLLESFVSTYMALFIYSLSTCDSRLLYRLSGQNFSNDTWSTLFGGGMKKLLIKPASQPHAAQAQAQAALQQQQQTAAGGDDAAVDENSVWNTVTSITKQRMKLNMKILGSFSQNSTSSNMKEDKPTYREQFMPPETSMLSYFLAKPTSTDCDDYDTDDSHESDGEEEEDDDDDVNVSRSQLKSKENTEHTNPTSYSWSILRLALIKNSTHKIQEFVKVAGIELQDLPVISPLSHEVLRTLNRWQEFALNDLISRGPPSRNYIPGCYAESGINGLAIHKYRSLLNKDNTPFISGSAAGPIRRLWNYLVRQEPTQEVFIKSIFGKSSDASTRSSHHNNHHQHDNETDEGQSHSTNENTDHIRIIHKDHESILTFCLKNNSSSMIAFANPREIQEFDISLLLESPNWYEDECDYDMMNLSKDADTNSSAFLIIQSQEQSQFSTGTGYSDPSVSTQSASQSGRGTSMVLRHKVDNVKRMSAHPLMPLYLTGGQDGSVQIWEWGHQQPVCCPRTSGTYAKVTRCRFSEQGNKFGVGDGDGKLSLWQAGIASQNNRPFITYQCHNKALSDFVFLGSCSLLASAGQSSENKNINIWDTLLPHKKSCVSAFTCHDQGSSCLVFAPQHQVLISCGKRGDVCVFDVRQRTLRHRYQAHDSTIKCIALDPHEEFFVTGSIEGDIKIWDMNQFMLINTFPHEHAKNGFFKHTGQGVSQVYVDPFGRLFSCGSDGCMKVRLLVEKDNIVQSVY